MPSLTSVGVWMDVTLPPGTTSISSFELGGVGATNSGNGCAAIEIDGKILVDGQWGVNGFHLDFDPTETGAITNDVDRDFSEGVLTEIN